MDPRPEPDRLACLDRPLPPAFERREIALAPGRERAYDEAEWRGALVIVDRGEIELECLSGTSRRFGCGDILWLVGLPLRALHNRGSQPALIVAVSRRRHPAAQESFTAAMSSSPARSSIGEPDD
jgi:hypothetical protein